MKTFEKHESVVRSYCRSFPTVFTRGTGAHLYNEAGKRYIDFFAGAGALNYGHNNPLLKQKLLEYIEKDGITHGLDMATAAKREFLDTFHDVILRPRNLAFKVQFTGPTGTNAVEAAMKLARKVTGRSKIISFTNAFHGMTLGALAVTGNAMKRNGAGVDLSLGICMPYCGYIDSINSLDYLDQMLTDDGSGIDMPAAIILETVQGEGGLNVASPAWLQRIEKLCKAHGMLLIIDDIQVGCGRTGPFFSFERAGINPDIVCLSKSVSGYGLPMAITLIRPEYDCWEPGEHNGTFRGNNLAFVTATAALNTYWRNEKLHREVEAKSLLMQDFLTSMAEKYPEMQPKLKGLGMIQGIECGVQDMPGLICKSAFERGLIMETAGPNDQVFKFLPPLTIDEPTLREGFAIVESSIVSALEQLQLKPVAV